MKTIRVILAEDHNIVRAGLRALLAWASGIEVIGEASDGLQALELVEKHHPDVLVTDISMPGMTGLDVAEHLKRSHSDIQVIILSMHSNEEYVWQALRAGALGYLLKDAGTGELELAIRSVARGETYLSAAISKQVVADYVRRVAPEAGPIDQITPRQREILKLLAEGHSTKDIASILKVSVKTVETHRAQLMERLDIHDVPGLVRYSIRIGLVESGK
jgi:DNA-binding NarL/FixJ family response regulator